MSLLKPAEPREHGAHMPPTRSVGWRPAWLNRRRHEDELARWRNDVASAAVEAAETAAEAAEARRQYREQLDTLHADPAAVRAEPTTAHQFTPAPPGAAQQATVTEREQKDQP